MADPAFLLDTNICIYILNDAQGLAPERARKQPLGSVVTSSIVAAELLRGVSPERAEDLQAIDRLFSLIEPLAFDLVTARAYALVPFKRAAFDRLIAAHALALDLTLVTNNERDFADIPGLRVENWAQP